jgi:hypothetical protein
MRCDGGKFRANLYLRAPDSNRPGTSGIYSMLNNGILKPGILNDDLDRFYTFR